MLSTVLPRMFAALADVAGVGNASLILASSLEDLDTGTFFDLTGITFPPAQRRLHGADASTSAALLRQLQTSGAAGYNANLGVDTNAANPPVDPATVAANLNAGIPPAPGSALANTVSSLAGQFGGNSNPSGLALAAPALVWSPSPSPSPSAAPSGGAQGGSLQASSSSSGPSSAVIGGAVGGVLGGVILILLLILLLLCFCRRSNEQKKAKEVAQFGGYIVPEHAAAAAHARRVSNLAAEWPSPDAEAEYNRASMQSLASDGGDSVTGIPLSGIAAGMQPPGVVPLSLAPSGAASPRGTYTGAVSPRGGIPSARLASPRSGVDSNGSLYRPF